MNLVCIDFYWSDKQHMKEPSGILVTKRPWEKSERSRTTDPVNSESGCNANFHKNHTSKKGIKKTDVIDPCLPKEKKNPCLRWLLKREICIKRQI